MRTLIEKANREVKDEIEVLISGVTIEKPIHEDIICYGVSFLGKDCYVTVE